MVPEKINLLTIKWGTKFPPAYPNLIHRMAKRHMPCKFDSYCMTDDPSGLDKDIIPVETTEKWLWNDIIGNCQGENEFADASVLKGLQEQTDIVLYTPEIEEPKLQWWFWDAVKMSIFAPKICGIEGKILFSDLDNIFLNRMDRVIQTEPPAIIKTEWNPSYHLPMHGGNYFLTMGFNASLIYVDNRLSVTNDIWEHFLKYYEKARGSLYSSDAYLWRCHRDKMNTYPSRTVYSHSRGSKYPDKTKYKLRDDHEVCIFMEDHEPDPLDIKEGWEADICKQYL